MCRVIIPGFNPERTTIAPSPALVSTKKNASNEPKKTEGRRLRKPKPRSIVPSENKPTGKLVSRLIYSTQTCTGLNSAFNFSMVISPSLRRNFSKSILSKSTSSMLEGGHKAPQQRGQSGQPSPEPLTRTIAPTKISRTVAKRAARAVFWKKFMKSLN